MIILNVPDMSCSHCTGVITKAIKGLDAQAAIAFDMHHHRVQIDTRQSTEAVLDTLTLAGYPATISA